MNPTRPPKTLKDWLAVIEHEVPYVDVKPYSHNIISLALQAIARQWGQKKANKAIKDFELDVLGWHEVKEKL